MSSDGGAVLKDLNDKKNIKEYDLSLSGIHGGVSAALASDVNWALIQCNGDAGLWDLRDKKNINNIMASKLGVEIDTTGYDCTPIDAGSLEPKGNWAIIVRGKSAFLTI